MTLPSRRRCFSSSNRFISATNVNILAGSCSFAACSQSSCHRSFVWPCIPNTSLSRLCYNSDEGAVSPISLFPSLGRARVRGPSSLPHIHTPNNYSVGQINSKALVVCGFLQFRNECPKVTRIVAATQCGQPENHCVAILLRTAYLTNAATL